MVRAKERAKVNGHRFLIFGVGPVPRRVLALTGWGFLLDDENAMDVLERFTGGQAREPDRAGQAGGDPDA